MNKYIGFLFDGVKQKKVYFVWLVLLTAVAIVLAVFAGLNKSGDIDLSNIVYIRFLQGSAGLGSFIFGMLFGLLISFFAILVCSCKPFLIWLSFLFYTYLIYTHAVVFVCIILVFGFFNCIIVELLLLVYILGLSLLFMFAMVEMKIVADDCNYFSACFNIKKCNVLFFLVAIVLFTLVFCIILTTLRSFVVLLVY